MKRHLNTLFVTVDQGYLVKQGNTVVVKVDRETKMRIPFHNLEGIVCFGNISCSSHLLGACAENGISVSFLSSYGRFLAYSMGFSPGNVLLRRTQYRVADSEADSILRVVRNIVLAKIANCRSVILRAKREAQDEEVAGKLAFISGHLTPYLDKVREASSPDIIRGLEGAAARLYFEGFAVLLKKESGFVMKGRTRRPPLDEVNALLSFIYSILCHDVRSACETVGLDSAVGFLHRDRPGRPGLALDLMEELRPYLADRLVASLINRRQISLEDFSREITGGYRMTDGARKLVLTSYQQRKDTEIRHPFIDEKITLGLLPHIQARLLARHLRGDLDEYPAFISR